MDGHSPRQDSASTSDSATLEDIVLHCVEARDVDDAVEQACREHPQNAELIRRTVQRLRSDALFCGPDEELPSGEGEIAIPARLGNYRLMQKIGEGGMGVVFRARDEHLGRDVAVKLVRPELLWFDKSKDRFAREVEAVARLHHPGIVSIYAVGDENGLPYFAMERISGGSLAERITDARMHARASLSARNLISGDRSADSTGSTSSEPIRRSRSWNDATLHLIRAVAEALEHAHAQGVLHRDIKPSNILIREQGRPVLVDFGLARVEGAKELTRSTSQIGSLAYTPPEAFDRDVDELDVTADVYALGVTLYETLTLTNPFAGHNAEETRRRIVAGEFERLRTVLPSTPWEAETVCLMAMERDPRRRYQTMQEFRQDIEAVLERRPIRAKRASPILRGWRILQRNPTRSVIALSALLLLAVVPTVFGLWQRDVAHDMQALSQQVEHNLYRASIEAASGSLAMQAYDRTEPALARAPQHLRGWEWHHLDWIRDRSIQDWQAGRETICTIATTPIDGSLVTVARAGEIGHWSLSGELLAQQTIEQSILAAALRPDGQELYISVVQPHQLWRLALEDGRLAPPELVSELEVRAEELTFAPSGTTLAVGMRAGKIQLRSANGELVASHDLPTNSNRLVSVEGLCFSPDNEQLAAVCGTELFVLRNPLSADAPNVQRVELFEEAKLALFLMDVIWLDMQRLVVAGNGGICWVVDIDEGTKQAIPGHTQGPLLRLDENRLLAKSGVSQPVILDTSNWRRTRTGFHGHAGRISAMARAGNRLVSGDQHGQVRVWDLDMPAREVRFEDRVVQLVPMAGTNDGLWIGHRKGGIWRWPTKERHPRSFHEAGDDLVALAVHDATVAVVTARIDPKTKARSSTTTLLDSSRADAARVIDFVAQAPGEMAERAFQPRGCQFGPDGTLHLIGDGADWARVPPGESEALVLSGPASHSGVRMLAMALLRQGRERVALTLAGELLHWNDGDQAPSTLATKGHWQNLRPTTDGLGFHVYGLAPEIAIWRCTQPGQLRQQVAVNWPHQMIRACHADAANDRIFVGTMDRRLRVYELSTGEPLLELQRMPSMIYDLRWLPDSDTLACSSMDGTLRFYRTHRQNSPAAK